MQVYTVQTEAKLSGRGGTNLLPSNKANVIGGSLQDEGKGEREKGKKERARRRWQIRK